MTPAQRAAAARADAKVHAPTPPAHLRSGHIGRRWAAAAIGQTEQQVREQRESFIRRHLRGGR